MKIQIRSREAKEKERKEDKILLSHDYFAFIDFGNSDFEKQQSSARDFTTVHKKLIPALEKLGVKKETLKKFTVDNPKRILQGK